MFLKVKKSRLRLILEKRSRRSLNLTIKLTRKARRSHKKTNLKGPIRVWVPKNEIVFAACELKEKNREIIAPRQWLLTTFNKKKAYIPNPNSERGRRCGIWKKQVRQAYWY